jgi:hypothetical protein
MFTAPRGTQGHGNRDERTREPDALHLTGHIDKLHAGTNLLAIHG